MSSNSTTQTPVEVAPLSSTEQAEMRAAAGRVVSWLRDMDPGIDPTAWVAITRRLHTPDPEEDPLTPEEIQASERTSLAFFSEDGRSISLPNGATNLREKLKNSATRETLSVDDLVPHTTFKMWVRIGDGAQAYIGPGEPFGQVPKGEGAITNTPVRNLRDMSDIKDGTLLWPAPPGHALIQLMRTIGLDAASACATLPPGQSKYMVYGQIAILVHEEHGPYGVIGR